jgi:hypothetical protein
MSDFTTAKTFTQGLFEIIVDWTHEDLPLSYVFETEEEIKEHATRCNDYTDTHYRARVRAMYNGKEFGNHQLGSCYAYDCSPETDIENGISGYLEQMVEQAVAEAQDACGTMLEQMQKDFA